MYEKRTLVLRGISALAFCDNLGQKRCKNLSQFLTAVKFGVRI